MSGDSNIYIYIYIYITIYYLLWHDLVAHDILILKCNIYLSIAFGTITSLGNFFFLLWVYLQKVLHLILLIKVYGLKIIY